MTDRLKQKWREARGDCDDEPGKRPDRPRIKEEPVGVWLVIRHDVGDSGVRPIPDGEVFWASPDIWISGGDALGNAIAGKPTPLHARIWNFGAFMAAPVRVDFRFVAPSIGIPWSAPKLVGTAWVNVPPLSTTVADCPVPWIPADTGLSHACLIVTCSSPLMDPPDQPGAVKLDRKTGQRNVTVVQAAEGAELDMEFAFARTIGTRGTVRFGALMTLGPHGPARFAADVASLTRTLRRMVAAGGGIEAGLARRALALHLSGQDSSSIKRFDAADVARMVRFKTEARIERATSGKLDDPDLGSAILHFSDAAHVEPLTPTAARLSVTVPPLGRQTAVLHLMQFEDGAVTGGHTIVFRPDRTK
jgi:hypothetical protein